MTSPPQPSQDLNPRCRSSKTTTLTAKPRINIFPSSKVSDYKPRDWFKLDPQLCSLSLSGQGNAPSCRLEDLGKKSWLLLRYYWLKMLSKFRFFLRLATVTLTAFFFNKGILINHLSITKIKIPNPPRLYSGLSWRISLNFFPTLLWKMSKGSGSPTWGSEQGNVAADKWILLQFLPKRLDEGWLRIWKNNTNSNRVP